MRPEDLSEAEREKLEDFPTAWIPDSRYLVELANASYKERLGRDVFLTDGEYRARPIAISLFTWGLYGSRADVLEEKFGDINWKTIHDAAIAKGGWPELGGEPGWGFFKLVVPNPNKNVGGLTAMIAAAGEYYGRTDISVADVTNPEFQAWLRGADGRRHRFQQRQRLHRRGLRALRLQRRRRRPAPGKRSPAEYAGHQHPLGRSALKIYYPDYVTWFDFPFTVWVGPETSALQKNAALEFQRFLLSEEQQQAALDYGLRPANPNVPWTPSTTASL